jgi:hypothetical protein
MHPRRLGGRRLVQVPQLLELVKQLVRFQK